MARHARRLILRLVAVLLSLALLVVLAVVVLLWGVDPDRYRATMERAATEALGRQVELAGKLRWRPGLNFRIESQGGRVANLPGFGSSPLASWQELRLGIALRPLWNRRLVIDRIEIDGLRLNLVRGAQGVNWSLPAAGRAQADTGPSLSVGHVILRDGAVGFTDLDSGRTWSATGLATDVELPARLDAAVLVVKGLSLRARLEGAPLDPAGVGLQVTCLLIEIDRQRGYMRVPEWRMMWAEASLGGTLGIAMGDSLVAEGSLQVQAPSLRRLLQSVSIRAPATRDARVLGPLRLDMNFRTRNGGIELSQLDMGLDSTRVEGTVELATLSPLSMRFDLAADEVDVDRYLTPHDQPGRPLSLPLAQLRALDVKGVLTIRRATVAGAQARELRIDVD